MPEVAHRKLWLGVAAVILALQGCGLGARHYPAPPEPLQPTVVGVIRSVSLGTNGSLRVLLEDGRTFDWPEESGFKSIGAGPESGGLLLARPGNPGFADTLEPSGPDCWEAWQGPSSNPIVWDMGDSILFPTGVELPKASGFTVEPQPHEVDGRIAWTVQGNEIGMNFCASSQGQIVSGQVQQ